MIQFAEQIQTIEAGEDQRQALGVLNEALAHAAIADDQAYLCGPDGDRLVLPESLFRVLRQAVILLSHGERVIVAPMDKEISTQEAADLLNMSRPFLVTLLDRGEIPCEKNGRYRKVRFGDVMEYKKMRNSRRAEILANMMQQNRRAGIYDKPDTDIPDTR